MSIDVNMFDFDAMKQATGSDPFAQATRKWETDDRFYKLPKDEEGNGQAIIRFLPDAEKNMIQQVYKINTTITTNGKRRFVNELSPQTAGKPCPFQEKWVQLYNSGDKEAAKAFSRTTRYYTNIKVLKDPRQPENEGKIFLLDMSNSMKDKIQALLQPSEQDIALGAEAKQLYNPLKGNSFKLACKIGSNGITNYDTSAVVDQVNSIYETVEEALTDIKENTHRLSQFLEDDAYMSYEELQKKLEWVQGVTAPAGATPSVQSSSLTASAENALNQSSPTAPEVHEASGVQEVQEVQEVQQTETKEVKSDSLDDLLAGLI